MKNNTEKENFFDKIKNAINKLLNYGSSQPADSKQPQSKPEEDEETKRAKEEAKQLRKQEGLEKLKVDYRNLLNTTFVGGLGSRVSYFDKNATALFRKYQRICGVVLTRECIQKMTRELYFDHDENVQKVLLEGLAAYLYNDMIMEYQIGREYAEDIRTCYRKAKNQAAFLTTRALHFKEYENNEENYPNPSTEIYDKYHEQEHLGRISSINSNIFYRFNGECDHDNQPIYFPNIKSDPYYMDALCYDYVNTILDKYQKEFSSDPDYIFNIIYNHIKPSASTIQMIEEEHRKDKIRKQCYGCCFYDRCPQRNERENCTAFLPK